MTNCTIDFTVATLEQEARSLSGHDRFGPEEYRPALTVLIEALAENPYLSHQGVAQIRAMLVGLLVARLRAQARLETTSGLLPVRKPWFILAMPRSGTTALHRLLCADPAAQGLESWIASNPQPRPPLSAWATHPDYRQTREQLADMRVMAPDLFRMHEMLANEVDECSLVLKQSFASMTFFQSSTAPAYERWLWNADVSGSYSRFREMLSLIDGGHGQRWVLKDPSHIVTLDALHDEFPDLRVICIRRPVEPVIPSVAALVYYARRITEPDVPKELVGHLQLECWSRCAHALIDWRARNPDIPWVDVEMARLRTDPVGTLRTVYEDFGEEFTNEAAASIAEKAAALKAGHTGAPIDPEEYGLTTAAIRAAFPAEFLA